MDYDRDRWQMEIKRTPVEEIMRSLAFETGVDDARKGYPPRYDDPMRERLHGWTWTATENDSVNYERGRQFPAADLRSMHLRVRGGRLNSRAVKLFRDAVGKGFITYSAPSSSATELAKFSLGILPN
jgi:hypothetical protein